MYRAIGLLLHIYDITPIRKAVSFAQSPCCFTFPVRGSRSLVWLLSAVCCGCNGFRRIIRLFAGPCIVICLVLSAVAWSCSWSEPFLSWSWSGPVRSRSDTYSNCAAMLASLASCYTLNIIIYSYRINTSATR